MNAASAIALLIVFSLVIGYLMGSVMFADVFGKILNKDVRKLGSNNPGATNSIRVFGLKIGFLVGLCDALKGFLAFVFSFLIFSFWLQQYLNVNQYQKVYYLTYLSCFAATIGHIFPLYFKFKGGKAIATTGGSLLAISLWWFVICLVLWLLVTLITKYVSLASLVTFFILAIIILVPWLDYLYFFKPNPINAISYQNDWYIILFFVLWYWPLTIAVFWLHRKNIHRLLNKTENKVTQLN
ncbi:glycerol-3-phosphate 1-O-acyltransferase PlsY [Mycoplasmoides pneumoniae]|uniref:glycerol-3-phosphate 1-O-acyltransferase PlsY n=1 Tax=Mycoplasmoides pneumoniae TaxID=2104 RepID=UPI0027DF7961|nr:glycerol-3-phosphate 1-O-acyltransferase PlsY [Mycoplasmoides pneumoniae]